jgi:hypothetical protein
MSRPVDVGMSVAAAPETVIGENLHAMVTPGTKNSRMRDVFDVDALGQRGRFQGEQRLDAVRATFARRGTPVPIALPAALGVAFSTAPDRLVQWAGFQRRSRLPPPAPDPVEVVERLAQFFGPLLETLHGRLTSGLE